MKNFITALFMAGLFTGCYTSHRTLTWTKAGTIPAGSRIAVIIPADGAYIDENYPQSGLVAARKLTGALAPYFPGSESVKSAAGFPYYIKPELTHWEERATEWSGKPDRVTVTLPLYSTGSGALISAAVVKANSSWWTFGGDHPEDLVDIPFSVYATKLAGKPKPHHLVIED